MKNLFNLSDQVVVITGATGVLAGGAAKYLQAQGAHVVYLGRRKKKVDEALTEAKSISENCSGYTCDVTD